MRNYCRHGIRFPFRRRHAISWLHGTACASDGTWPMASTADSLEPITHGENSKIYHVYQIPVRELSERQARKAASRTLARTAFLYEQKPHERTIWNKTFYHRESAMNNSTSNQFPTGKSGRRMRIYYAPWQKMHRQFFPLRQLSQCAASSSLCQLIQAASQAP